MEWYEATDLERYKAFNKKFSLKQFFEWWQDSEDEYMELRVKDVELITEYCNKYKAPRSAGGVFVNKHWQLEKAVAFFRKRTTVWFGVNPRRRVKNVYGKYKFTGKDIGISRIKFLFIDIDRKHKSGKASNEDLMNAELLSRKVHNELVNAGFGNNYVKICSGNGLQVLYKLDVPFELPLPTYDYEKKLVYEDEIFLKVKNTLYKGIGPIISSFSKKASEDLNAEIDSTGFNLNRVAALHETFNFKYEKPIPRGIIALESGSVNDGFSDYLKGIYASNESKADLKKKFNPKAIIELTDAQKASLNNLNKNSIVRLMTEFRFPDGGINNTLWYGLKILLHAAGVIKTDSEYVKTHSILKSAHNRSFSDNGLESQYKGNDNGPLKMSDVNIVPAMVNKYLRLHKIVRAKDGVAGYHKPLFSVSPYGKNIHDITVGIKPEYYKNGVEGYEISDQLDDPLTDVKEFSNRLHTIRRGDTLDDEYAVSDYKFTEIGLIMVKERLSKQLSSFMLAFRDKWGVEVYEYMVKHYFNDYINYRRWRE